MFRKEMIFRTFKNFNKQFANSPFLSNFTGLEFGISNFNKSSFNSSECSEIVGNLARERSIKKPYY